MQIALLLLPVAAAYVQLLYPPARDLYSVDVAESSRPPCGSSNTKYGSQTWLRSGQHLNISWFLSTPHHGGFKLEVLDKNDELAAMLTPLSTYSNAADPTKSSQTVIIPPDLQCFNCSIRLVRQAKEFGADYQFYSCANVNIAEVIPDGDTCFGQGTRKNSTCECKPFSSGDDCSVKDECWGDEDCGIGGKCMSVNERMNPRKQCFCKNGHYGDRCELGTHTIEGNFDPSLYSSLNIGDDKDKIYWRILQDEIEFVLKFEGKSWAAIGWKSQSTESRCAALNGYKEEREEGLAVHNSTQQVVENGKPILPSLRVEPIEKEITTSSLEHCSENEVFSNCPEFTRQCEASCEWTSFPETIPDCPRTCGSQKCICKEGFVRVSSENDTCVPFNFCSNQADVQCPGNATWAKCGVACEPTCENMYDTSPCEATCDVPACTCADNYVRYKGQCIFWGDCPNLEQHWATEAVTKESTTEVVLEKERTSTASVLELNEQMGVEELTCGINETINECGKICEPDCVTVFLREECSLCAKPACSCIEGYARHNDKCIYWGDCSLDVKSLRPTLEQSLKTNSSGSPAFFSNSQSNEKTLLENTDSLKMETSLEGTSSSMVNDQNLSSNITEEKTENRKNVDEMTEKRKEAVSSGESTSSREGTEIGIARASAVKSAQYPSDKKDESASGTMFRPPVIEEKDSGVVGDVCYGDWRWPPGCRDCDYRISWNYLDESDEIEFSIETRAPSNWWTGVGISKTGSMAEADMIVVKSRNGHLTLHDMYATGYGIPREDKEQNVYTPTIVGTHVNGVLRAQFTRKRDTGDRVSDHRFSDTDCYKFLFPVSGGKLDENGQFAQHVTIPHVSENEICIRSCTSPQALQPTTSCESEFRYPTGCEGTACDYVAKWEYSMIRKDVRFEISAKELGRWTGIGFSRDGAMANSDIYTGWAYEGKAFVTDRFAYGRQLPAIDPSDRQDIYDVSGKIEDDIQTISFRRKIVTADAATDFPLNKCYYFLFPIGGGRVLARKTHDFQNAKTPIGYHDLYQPRVSRTKICICDKNGVPVASEDPPPAIRRRRQAQDPFEFQVDPFLEISATNNPESMTSSSELPNTQISTTTTISKISADLDNTDPETSSLPPDISTTTIMTTFVTLAENNIQQVLKHPMDCADFVIGSMVGGVFRVKDYFATSRSTPQLDLFYGGKDSITAAAMYEKDGFTTLMFRKPLRAEDVADNSIINGPMTLLWAKGTLLGSHEQNTLFKDEIGKNGNFYFGDLIKYDGKKHGGILTVDFFAEQKQKSEDIKSLCSGSFAYPANCNNTQCKYIVSWKSDGKKVDFALQADLQYDHWTGVGYSLDGSMAKSDIIGISIPKDSIVRVLDYYSPGYGRPKLDEDQGTFDIYTVYESGRVYANFSRSLASTDEQDLSLDQCVYFIFPTSGGPLEEGSGDIRKHFESPISSKKRVCLNTCKPEKAVEKVITGFTKNPILKASILPDEPSQHPKTTYDIRLRILNRDWSPELLNEKTPEFKQMSHDITNAVNTMLNAKWPDLKVSRIIKFSKGNVFAQLLVATDEDVSPTAASLKNVLEEYAMQGPVESLKIEPTTIQVNKHETGLQTVSSEQLRNWIIIAIGVLLTLIATCFICCIFHRSRKARKSLKYGPYPVPCVMNGYDYEATMVPPMEKKGFENAAFQTTVHARQFSQATTASQNGKNSLNSTQESPKGVGETTYQEWFTKVASKPASQHHQESALPSPGRPSPTRQSYGNSPYVSYPNDPINFYTLNGEHRVAPSRYLRPF